LFLVKVNQLDAINYSPLQASLFYLQFNFIYLFVSRHEVHSTNTHTLHNAGR